MRKLAIVLLALTTIGGMAYFSALRAQSQPPTCVEDWYSLTDAERIQCANVVGGMGAVMETNQAIDYATTAARPSSVPGEGLTAEAELLIQLGNPSIVPTLPPGIIPERYQRVEEVPSDERYGTSASSKYYSSVWQVGGISNAEGDPEMLLIGATRDVCALRTFRSNGPRFFDIVVWLCPEELGEIVINSVSAAGGTVAFTFTASGDTGTFDLTTKAWTRNGNYWGVSPNPTPESPYPAPYPYPIPTS